MAKAKANDQDGFANSNSKAAGVPTGMKPLSGSFAPTWDPEKSPEIRGTFSAPKSVELRQGKQVVERRCVEFTTREGERLTVWESAGLKTLFEDVTPGTDTYIRFDGLGTAKKNQNAPKLYTVAVK